MATKTAVAAPEPSGWGRWTYTGPAGRIYAHIPVTPAPGDVIAWPELPAPDGAWTPADAGAEVTRRPDNRRPDPLPTDAAGDTGAQA